MSWAAHHLVVLIICWWAVRYLITSSWPTRAPRTALLAWQLVGLSASLSAVGLALAVGLAPYDRGVLPSIAQLGADVANGTVRQRLSWAQLAIAGFGLLLAGWLLATAVRCALDTVRDRRRHRTILQLVARPDPQAGDALVVDHPTAAAYCVPGRRPCVVISAGALRILNPAQLRAVLAHEHAHANERHDLVMLPFEALRRALPRSKTADRAMQAVALLVEMRADDRAAGQHAGPELAAALLRFETSSHGGAPPGTLSAYGTDVGDRVRRLVSPKPPPRLLIRLTLLAGAATIASTPLSLFALPL
jgi:Peptidase family M48